MSDIGRFLIIVLNKIAYKRGKWVKGRAYTAYVINGWPLTTITIEFMSKQYCEVKLLELF